MDENKKEMSGHTAHFLVEKWGADVNE